MEDYTMRGTYTLPSLGKLYGENFNPEITLRSMTTNEEMKRLNRAEKNYAIMAEVIDDCIVNKQFNMSVYDMCIADYQFLLHKLRVVTYGSDYKVSSQCPYCASVNTTSIDLDSLEVKMFNEEEYNKYIEFDLPQTGKHIKLRMQTPRMMDSINARAKEQRRNTPEMQGDPAFLFTLEGLIAEIDGKRPDPIALTQFVRNMPMMDANYILRYSEKLTDVCGLKLEVHIDCATCGFDYPSSFRPGRDFFGPSIDI